METMGIKRGGIKPAQYKLLFADLVRPFGAVCWYCGRSGQYYSTWYKRQPFHDGLHIDHIVPVSCGGTDDLDNLALACPPCNRAKSNLSVPEFYKYLDFARSHHSLFDPAAPHPTSSLFLKS